MMKELLERGHFAKSEVPIEVIYRGESLGCGFRIDLLVEDLVLVELKAVDRIAPVHVTPAITYLKLSNLNTGLIINFNVELLRNKGIRHLRVD